MKTWGNDNKIGSDLDYERRLAQLTAENERIVAESKQCHEQNDRLVSERMKLRAALREVGDIVNSLTARGENAYSQGISQARQDACLGWEIKVERNEFGRDELDAHNRAAEWLGRHRAMIEAADELRAILDKYQKGAPSK
jgi:uncharacterized protein YPO0396